MPQKGMTNNPNGRKKGVPNKSTDELRGLLQCFIENNIDRLQYDFDLLEPKDRLLFIDKMLRMILPPPLDILERLTDEQLDQVISKLREQRESKIDVFKQIRINAGIGKDD